MNRSTKTAASEKPEVRCAIYTRKSTEEGLEQEFNSLDAQRESGEAYIKSQAHEGWVCLPAHYDDGGFTGGNMDRPAVKRLLADIEAGRIDSVVVYKVDRLSRSLLDFAKMMETFDEHHISFVSVTQQFNTASSMGRLVLNVLLSFAQFEREIISERTRDKIAAARRKGKWSGGMPLLGYDVGPRGSKLSINDDEAGRVRAIFQLYMEYQALLPVVQELERRDWRNKTWTTRKGRTRGGKPFTKTSLHKLLTNVAYTGKVRYKTEIHGGEHAGIVDAAIWQRVQAILQRNGRTGGSLVRNKFGALLKGLLHCVPCGCAMSPSHSTRNGTKRYRYYVCTAAQKRGWQTCPSKSVPAGEVERYVVAQLRGIGQDPSLLQEVLAQVQDHGQSRREELQAEQRVLVKDLARWHADVRTLAKQIRQGEGNAALARLADLQERIRIAEQRESEVRSEAEILEQQHIHEDEVRQALVSFDPLWEALTPSEQTRIIQLLVERVDYDGGRGTIALTFHPAGIKTLAQEIATQPKEHIA
jgi:site-specific DNA recombinase